MSRDCYVLGVSMSRHDRSACLLKNGQVVGAIAEERLDRRKRSLGKYGHAAGRIVLPPLAAITYVLRQEAIDLADLDLVVCGRSMVLCRDALLSYLPLAPERVIEPPMPGHKAEPFTAAIRLASSNTIFAPLPPSSSCTRLRLPA